MKPFRIGTMCQLIEIICHSTQLADEICLLYGQSLNDISFIKNFSCKLTYGYSCVFSFTVIRYFFFSATPLVGRPPFLYSVFIILVSLI